MIISHQHKYLFVELPHTGSTAISHELREHYDGVSILEKHATYYQFLKVATAEEKQYWLMSSKRAAAVSVASTSGRSRLMRHAWH